MQRTDWMSDSLCRGLANDAWFPPLEASNPNDYYAVAREVCNRCPVWVSCLDYSNNNEEKFGMWGGLTPQERNVGRKTTLRGHGTITRYRQGCACIKCTGANNTYQPNIDLSVYPRIGEATQIDELKYKVLPNLK